MIALTLRQRNIIEYLLSRDSYVTNDVIASNFEVSNRTVRKDLEVISAYLKEQGISLVRKPGKGVWIENKQEVLFDDLSCSYSKNERIVIYVTSLLLNDVNTFMTLASSCGVSKQTVINDLNTIEKFLDGYHLSLIKNQGVGTSLEGDETDIRRLFIDLLFTNDHSKIVYELCINNDGIQRNLDVSFELITVIEILREIFTMDENTSDMFTSARREVLKFQIVSECFRSVHDANWQKNWYDILKKAFSSNQNKTINISISGLLIHIKLNESAGGEHILCHHPEHDDCLIDYWKLTAKEIQRDILGDEPLVRAMWTPDFDTSEEDDANIQYSDAVIDSDIESISMDNNSCDKQIVTVPEAQISFENVLVTETEENNSQNVTDIKDSSGQTSINNVSLEEIEQLVKDFKRSCGDYHVSLRECEAKNTVVGPSVIRLKFRLGRGQALQGLVNHLEDIGREMKRTGVIIQQVPNSDELLLDVPRLKREKVLFRDVISSLPEVKSPEQLFFPLGRTPNGKDLIEDLGQMPHMLVGGSTGSGKSVFLFSMLAALLMTHPHKEDLQLILSSSKLEDFIHFEGLPHLYSGSIISDATEATRVIKEVVFEESERRGKILADARVANIIEYNKIASEKLSPIVVVIDEFADLADQLETKKEQNAFYKPVQRIAQTGRSRGIHLVICTQRPEAKLVPSTTKAQLNGRVALRVNDGISSRMIIESSDAQYLQKHGDMIYKNGDVIERAQGYLIEIPELDEIVSNIINGKY